MGCGSSVVKTWERGVRTRTYSPSETASLNIGDGPCNCEPRSSDESSLAALELELTKHHLRARDHGDRGRLLHTAGHRKCNTKKDKI
ncbi:hypothetical protein TNCV_3752881 [Trichonephila clavipes]|nr:hypothetical protein TNCV_3752881 [Trichonephila clavipes]